MIDSSSNIYANTHSSNYGIIPTLAYYDLPVSGECEEGDGH